MIKVVINADDFGYSRIFNAKILDLLQRGAIKSATILVNRIDDKQQDVSQLISVHKNLDVGIGIEYELTRKESATEDIDAQYKKFISVFGFSPSHFSMHLPKVLRDRHDSSEIIKSLAYKIQKFAQIQNIPMDNDGPYGIEDWGKVRTTTVPIFMGTYHNFKEIQNYFEKMKNGKSYEIIFHPGEYDPVNTSSLNAERKNDYDNILRLQEWLKPRKDIQIISFLNL